MKYISKIHFLALVLLSFFFVACDSLERDIDLNLPEPERMLTVECYLEAGQPYRVLLTETKGFFENLNACPLVKGATVIIRYNGIADTLRESFYFSNNCPADSLFGFVPFFNADFTRFYNYGSSTICLLDYDRDFELEVIDNSGGRHALASTRFLRPVPVESMDLSYKEGKASVLISALDNAATVDFYRVMLHLGSLTEDFGMFNVCKDPEFDVSIDDARFFNGGKVSFGTGFNYEPGDTLIASFYKIDKIYHDFLETVSDAESANFSPFAQPSRILTNIVGGQGIFTALSYSRDTIIVN
jgi:hypothetical protein